MKIYLIRNSNTIYGLISFDYELEAAAFAERHGTTCETHWAGPTL